MFRKRKETKRAHELIEAGMARYCAEAGNDVEAE